MNPRAATASAVSTTLILVWIVSFGLGSASAKAEEVGELVDRAVVYHGGEIFRQSLSSFQVCSKSGCYRVRSRIDGGLFELEAEGPVRDGRRRVRITNDTVEYWHDGALREVTGDRAQSLRNWVMARVYFVNLPFRLDDESVRLQDLGVETWGGRDLRKVKVTFVPGSSSGADDEFLYWFDPATARLEQFAYSFSGNPGGLRFRRGFNYRREGGLLFFDQENWGIDGEGLVVEETTPNGVQDWSLISTVTVRDVQVESQSR